MAGLFQSNREDSGQSAAAVAVIAKRYGGSLAYIARMILVVSGAADVKLFLVVT